MKPSHKIWAVVVAAGIGKRMNAPLPKQYLELNGIPVLQHSLQRLLDNPHVTALVVALREADPHWPQIRLDTKKPVLIAPGGDERSDSVLSALNCLQQQAEFDPAHDWVLVHDAVRPCVRQADIDRLINTIGDSEAGGLLALGVRDTMKRQSADGTVAQNVDREGLWHALTPQLFPWRLLQRALTQAAQNKRAITDESSAMEAAGYAPRLVEGSADNIKITRPGDIRLAELYLEEQQKSQ
ncbi:MAG: 2-C-methyl-D-erythritol 4-phosphate cytidylyltransferase [Gammaproteobacteria bacterium]